MVNKFKINPAIPLAILIAAATGTGVAYHLNHEKLEKGDLVPHEIGHEDIIPYLNLNVKSSDFVLLNAGSSKNLATILFDQKIKYCNDNNIACGLIINSTAETEYEIYNDVEYVKSIIAKYEVDCPVYLNIKSIMKNEKLNNTEKQKYINIFLETCQKNGIYVGISGEDDLLKQAKEYLDINELDAYVKMDGNQDYDGNYIVYKDDDGIIHATKDMAKYINEKGLNDISKFLVNKKETINSMEELEEIAFKNNISIDALLKYNKILKISLTHKFHNGETVTINIPNALEHIPYKNRSFVTVEEPLMGCDLSDMQEKNTDWDNMDFDFIIIRSNHGKTKDDCFEYNAKNCIENNIPIGAYCMNEVFPKENEPKEKFIERFKEQVEETLKTIKKYQIDLPVFIDLEGEQIEEEYLKEILSIWENKISKNGYIPGIYSNQSGMDYIIEKDSTVIDRFELWVAGGENYNQEIDINDVKPNFDEIKDYPTQMIQSTNSCMNAGAKNSDGKVDVDFTRVDYTREYNDKETAIEKYEIREYPKYTTKGSYIGGSLFLIGTATIGIGKIKRKIKAKKRR